MLLFDSKISSGPRRVSSLLDAVDARSKMVDLESSFFAASKEKGLFLFPDPAPPAHQECWSSKRA